MECDLIISGSMLLASARHEPIRDGACAVIGDEIEAVGTRPELLARYRPKRQIHRPSGLVMPGLINTHTHSPMVLFRGLADDLPLKVWLEEHIFPREAGLTPELIRLATRLACAEMIRSGTTSFVDMYFFEDVMAETASEIGLRGWYGEGLFDFPSPAYEDGFAALDATRRYHERFSSDPLVTIVVAPHTPYTCSTELLEAAAQCAADLEARLIIHVSETAWEVEETMRSHQRSPVGYLDAIGLLNDKVLAVHGVHLSQEDIEILHARGTSLSHCPESNLKLGSGICPTWALLERGVNVCLGTDGAASNNNLDMFGEMDFAAKLPKGVKEDSSIITARQVLDMATVNGAEALGRPDLGRIEAGCKADLVILDLDRPGLTPCYNPVSHIVYAATGGDVSDVVVAGRVLMERGELTTIDEEELMEQVRTALSRWQL